MICEVLGRRGKAPARLSRRPAMLRVGYGLSTYRCKVMRGRGFTVRCQSRKIVPAVKDGVDRVSRRISRQLARLAQTVTLRTATAEGERPTITGIVARLPHPREGRERRRPDGADSTKARDEGGSESRPAVRCQLGPASVRRSGILLRLISELADKRGNYLIHSLVRPPVFFAREGSCSSRL
jgi:hypothetical protein